MARDGKGKRDAANAAPKKRAADESRAAVKLARVVARRIEKLERLLVEAARVERKRVRALDRAHRRRQLIQAALDEMRTEGAASELPAPVSPEVAPAPQRRAASAPVAPKAPAAAPKPAARTPAAPKAPAAARPPTRGTAAATRATKPAPRPRTRPTTPPA
jgi:hypothetical protein